MVSPAWPGGTEWPVMGRAGDSLGWHLVGAGGGGWGSCPAARRAFTAGGGAQACAGGAFAAISFIVRDGWFRGGHRWAQPFSDCHHCTIACPCMSFLAVLALGVDQGGDC